MALPIVILFIFYAPPGFFAIFIGLVTYLGLHEFYAMALPEDRVPERVAASLAGTVLYFVLGMGYEEFFPPAFIFIILTASLSFLFRYRNLATVPLHLALVILGIAYIPMLTGHFALLRYLPFGREWVFLVLLVVMAGDTGAYFTGVSMGRRKLYPAISPNKSVEGAIGGLAGSLCGPFLARASFFPSLEWYDCIALGLSLGTMGQLGDLFESMLKRGFGVKDSGVIIPGHGGILDRLDSLLFAFPVAYYYALIRFGG